MNETAQREAGDGSYAMAVVVALLTGAVAVVCAVVLRIPMRDPDGFLGPTYIRLPLIAAGLLAVDVVPRAIRRARAPREMGRQVLDVYRERWPWRRLRPVFIGLAAFYATYVSYRTLKGFLPLLRPNLVDDQLRRFDEAVTGGVQPAVLLHNLLGTGISAHVLSWVYLAFLVFVPASLGLVLVANGRARQASWYVTALCLNWAFGTASYYLLPSLGPVYFEPGLFTSLPATGASELQSSLLASRALVVTDPHVTERVQSIAAFASLHVSIIFTAALIAQLVLRSKAIRAALWVYFVLTTLSTIYFGWHYLADGLAGLGIGLASVLLAAWGTGQFRRRAVLAGGSAENSTEDTTEHEPASTATDGPGWTWPTVRLRRPSENSPSAP